MTIINHPGSDHLASMILAAALDCIIAIDETGQVIEWNPAAEKTFGYSREEALGRSLNDLIIPSAYHEAHQHGLERYLKTGEARVLNKRLELQGQRRNGSTFPCELAIHPARAEGAVYFTAYLRDITEQRQAQERAQRLQHLLTSQARILESIARGEPLARILEDIAGLAETERPGLRAGILVYDANTHQLRHGAAPNLPAEFNAAIDGIQPCLTIGPCSTAAHNREPVYMNDIQSDERWLTFRDLTAPHGLRACWSTPMINETGQLLGTFALYDTQPGMPDAEDQYVIGVATHLAGIALENERKSRELRSGERRYRELLDNVPQIIWTINADGTIDQVNQQWVDYFGLPHIPENEEWREFLHPDDRGRIFAEREKHIQARETYSYEARFRRFDGEYRWFLVRAQTTRAADGTFHGWVGGATDIHERKQAEQQAQWLARVVEESSDFIGIAELNNGRRYLNRAGREMVGLDVNASREDGDVLDFFLPEDRAFVRDVILPTAFRAGRWQGDFRFRHFQTGEAIDVDYNQFVITDPHSGEPIALATVTRDVRERKRAEAEREAAQATVRRHAELLDLTHDAVIMWTLNGGITYWNCAAAELYGYTAAEAVGKVTHDLLGTRFEGLPDARAFEAQLCAQGEWRGRLTHTLRDGRKVIVDSRHVLVPGEHPGELAVLETNRDVTEQVRAEQALHDSQARLRFALEAAGLGDWVLDLRDHSSWRSLRHDEIFGYPEGHATWTYETFLQHVVPEDREETDRKFRVAVERGEVWDVECRVRRADGEERWVWTRAKALRDQDGNEHLMLGIVGDMTNLKRAEAEVRALNATLEDRVERRTSELRQANVELRRSNTELERFAFVASHDLQEPLRTISSFSELLDQRYSHALDEKGRKYLSMVTRGAQRMKVLIDDLLVFSRLNAVHEPLQPLDASKPLAEALLRLDALIERTGARVESSALPVVLGAEGELTQLFQNLVGNAVKFRREGVTPVVRVDAREEQGMWRFTVGDNGIGIDQKYFERVFELFHRLHVHDKYEGTGLGLSIVRKIVDRHGGRIWVESEPGVGTRMHFTLRKAEEAGV